VETAGWLNPETARARKRKGQVGGMTESTREAIVECLHCGVEFSPRKAGHVYHSIECRHRGERAPHERTMVDPEAVGRLFDPARDPDERVRPDDWFPGPAEAAGVYSVDDVGTRRRWYRNLLDSGRL
jgi:hypothetical protein